MARSVRCLDFPLVFGWFSFVFFILFFFFLSLLFAPFPFSVLFISPRVYIFVCIFVFSFFIYPFFILPLFYCRVCLSFSLPFVPTSLPPIISFIFLLLVATSFLPSVSPSPLLRPLSYSLSSYLRLISLHSSYPLLQPFVNVLC